jgi:DNA modification methylase
MAKTASEQRAIRITCSGAGTVELERVKGIQGNLKRIDRKELEKLKHRILKHGFNVPYHIWRHGDTFNLLDGHQRTKALLELQAQGYTVPELPYDLIEAKDMADAKDKLLGISSQYGDFTIEGIRDFIGDGELDLDLRLPSGEIRLESVRADESAGGDDDEPEAAPKISRLGDIYELGPHRLVVGDCTSKDAMAKLMGDQAAQLVFTDPPYGVGYDGADGGILNDEKKGQELEHQLLAPAFKLAARYSMEDAAYYIWHASATRPSFQRAILAAGLEERQYIIWVKPAATMGRSQYQWQHEPCFYCGRHGIVPRWTGDRKQTTVWVVTQRKDGAGFVAIANGVTLVGEDGAHLHIQREPPKGKKARSLKVGDGEVILLSSLEGSDVWEVQPDSKSDYMHPNQKPVELSMRAIINNTEPGEVVLDMFTGSGSTLIGTQRANRVFRGLELDPRWADLIVKRWCLWMFRHHMEPVLTRNGKPYEWQKFCPELMDE